MEQQLPPLNEGDSATVRSAEAEGHDTQPPARYTEASLVKKLEELEVGRPSTYASIMRTIQDREYVWKRGSALVPSFKAFAVVTLLEEHFPDLVDYAFTAEMENDLDEIALGGEERVPWLTTVLLRRCRRSRAEGQGERSPRPEIDARAVNSIPIGADSEGQMIVARVGRYGPYLERGEARASIPNDILPDELTVERALELINAPQGDRELGTHPDDRSTDLRQERALRPLRPTGRA